jgi:hypothetical protein
MYRIRFAGRPRGVFLRGAFGPLAACLLISLLAACGQSRPGPQAHVSSGGDWQRPASYDPPGPPGDPWGPWITQASRRFDIPERWIREVMRQESGGRANATSRVGAMGLMQVMPGTYRELQARYGLGPDPYHPWDSLMAGTAYLRQMYELYGNPAFLAAYNAGPRRLEDYLWGNRGLPNETRNYVARIGPRIQGVTPGRRAAPEVYAAAEIPLDIPAGPRRGDAATMMALREQRRAVDPGIQVAVLPPGPVVRMDPIPDGSTQPPPTTQLAALGSVTAMAPVASLGDFQRRMEPISSPGDPGTVTRMEPIVSAGDPGSIQAETLPPARGQALAAAPMPAARSFSLVPQAQAGTLPVPPRQVLVAPAPAQAPARAPTPAPALAAPPAGGGAWGIQVGAFASENLARAAAGQARDTVATRGTRTVVEPVTQGRERLFRARIVGLADRGAAEQACQRLRGRGACMVVAPGV